MFRMREAVHISRQQLFLMREAVKHFTPTSVPDARSRYIFRANTLPSTEGNIPCNFDIPEKTVYFISMNIRLLLHLKWMEHSSVNRTVYLHSTFSTSRELSYPWTVKKTHLLHLLHQHLLSSTILLSCCDCVIRSSFKNVVKVNDHHLGLCSYYTVIFLNI